MRFGTNGRRAALCTLLLAVASSFADAAELADKPLRIVVPFAAGGTADVLARMVAEKLKSRFPQGVIVENRTGAGGNVGAEAVARSEADGHTLLLSSPGPISVNQSLYPKLPFDPDQWVPVTVIAEVPNALVTGTKLPVATAADFVRYVTANPGKVSYASQGNGTTSHLTAKLYEQVTGAEMIHVPYRGRHAGVDGPRGRPGGRVLHESERDDAAAQVGQGADCGGRGCKACELVARRSHLRGGGLAANAGGDLVRSGRAAAHAQRHGQGAERRDGLGHP